MEPRLPCTDQKPQWLVRGLFLLSHPGGKVDSYDMQSPTERLLFQLLNMLAQEIIGNQYNHTHPDHLHHHPLWDL